MAVSVCWGHVLANVASWKGTGALPMPGKLQQTLSVVILVMLSGYLRHSLEACCASESELCLPPLKSELEVASPLGLCFPFVERRTYWAHHLPLAQLLRQGRDLVNTPN